MGFRIQNNIAAMTAHRALAQADSGMTKSLERLSSGYRINRAADDAAGLAIASSFRADVAGARVAQRNISEGNAMLQVAEGALDQVGNIMTRMKELATQAASANTSSTARAKINAEYGQLKSEIDRIVNSTKYGATNLLDGTLAARAATPGTPATPAGPSTAGPITSVPAIGYGTLDNGTIFWNMGGVLINDKVTVCPPTVANGGWKLRDNGNGVNVDLIDPSLAVVDTATANGTNDLVFAWVGITITNVGGLTPADLNDSGLTIRSTGLTNLDVSGAAAGTYTVDYNSGGPTVSDGIHTQTLALPPDGAQTIAFNNIGITFTVDAAFLAHDLNNMQFTVTAGAPGNPGTPGDPGSPGAVFQVGSKNGADNRIAVAIASAKITDIGKSSGAAPASLSETRVDTAENAQAAMDVIDKAISDVSGVRGTIGACQNRFSFAAANLTTTVQNMSAAESVIRDADMADEMTGFTRNQILVQSATAMLAQANTAPQQILSLLKG